MWGHTSVQDVAALSMSPAPSLTLALGGLPSFSPYQAEWMRQWIAPSLFSLEQRYNCCSQLDQCGAYCVHCA